MNREKLQSLSEERVADAQALLDAARWSGAYYLVGYALECALKSCILAYIDRTGIIFQNKKFTENCWTHKIEELVACADLTADRGVAIGNNSTLGQNWQVAKDWSETDRYRTHTQLEAEKLFEAINHDTDGVLQWVRQYW